VIGWLVLGGCALLLGHAIDTAKRGAERRAQDEVKQLEAAAQARLVRRRRRVLRVIR
jgi:hypothetical protein